MKLVRRGDQPGPKTGAMPAFGATAQDLGFGAPPPGLSQMYGGGLPPSDLGDGLSLAPQPGRPSATGMRPAIPAFGASPFGTGTNASLPDPTLPSSTPVGRSAGAPRRGPGGARNIDELDATPQLPPMGPPASSGDRFAALDGFGDASADSGGAKCQVCGTALTDEFDKVIGLCDVHQRDRRGNEGGGAGGGQLEAAAAKWFARGRDGRVVGPVSLDDLRARIRTSELGNDSEYSKDGVTFGPLAKFPELSYLASLGGLGEAGLAGTARPKATYAATRGGGGFQKPVTYALAGVLVLGLGFLVYTQRAKLEQVVGKVTSDPKPAGPSTPNPLKRQLANWRLAHPDVSGTAHEHLVTARARHLEDTWRGYQLAEDAFERALLLDENDPEAIAGYVENLAIWRFPLATADEVRTAQAALKYALELAPESPAVHRGLGALALARGDLNACRSGADRALEKDQTDGMAKLLLAGCYLEGNVQLAMSEAEKSVRLLPELRRADRVLAQAYAKMGRYASAYRLLDARLKVDPKNAEVHLVYGQ
ncbi:tetratricopeptide repeat protein, partial [Myxococcota bacterium]|nr:tetratricopeptide repeat protein [Myxococcota bacterium]